MPTEMSLLHDSKSGAAFSLRLRATRCRSPHAVPFRLDRRVGFRRPDPAYLLPISLNYPCRLPSKCFGKVAPRPRTSLAPRLRPPEGPRRRLPTSGAASGRRRRDTPFRFPSTTPFRPRLRAARRQTRNSHKPTRRPRQPLASGPAPRLRVHPFRPPGQTLTTSGPGWLLSPSSGLLSSDFPKTIPCRFHNKCLGSGIVYPSNAELPGPSPGLRPPTYGVAPGTQPRDPPADCPELPLLNRPPEWLRPRPRPTARQLP